MRKKLENLKQTFSVQTNDVAGSYGYIEEKKEVKATAVYESLMCFQYTHYTPWPRPGPNLTPHVSRSQSPFERL